jgi:hypothetical protein
MFRSARYHFAAAIASQLNRCCCIANNSLGAPPAVRSALSYRTARALGGGALTTAAASGSGVPQRCKGALCAEPEWCSLIALESTKGPPAVLCCAAGTPASARRSSSLLRSKRMATLSVPGSSARPDRAAEYTYSVALMTAAGSRQHRARPMI